MCFTLEIVGVMINAYSNTFEKFNLLRKQLSEFDSQLQEIEHAIEFGKFNVVMGYQYSKKIKEVRIKRRAVKNELEMIQPLVRFLQKNHTELKKLSERLIKKETEKSQKMLSPQILILIENNNLENCYEAIS